MVAEGIETKEQMAFFRKHGCDELQGFLISRPIPESEFRRLFANAGPFSL